MPGTKVQFTVSASLLVLILIGIFLATRIDLAFSTDLEKFSGPRTYPLMILLAMLTFNVLIIGQSLLLAFRHRGFDNSRPAFGPGALRAALLFLLVGAFCLTYEAAGYILTMIPLLVATAWLNGARNWVAMIAVSLVLSIICLLIFRYALNTVLPEGLMGIDGIL